MASPLFHGGCQCGSNRYTISGQLIQMGFCHCTICRHLSGSPFLPFVRLSADSFSWSAPAQTQSNSEPRSDGSSSTLKTLHITDSAARTFCSACGTPLTFVHRPDRISVTAGSFDEEHGAALKDLVERGSKGKDEAADGQTEHIFTDTQAPWADLEFWASQVVEYDKFPEELTSPQTYTVSAPK